MTKPSKKKCSENSTGDDPWAANITTMTIMITTMIIMTMTMNMITTMIIMTTITAAVPATDCILRYTERWTNSGNMR